MRFEKFKSENITTYEKMLSERDSEVSILKEMVKAAQVQMRAKERETARFKVKTQQLESFIQNQKHEKSLQLISQVQ